MDKASMKAVKWSIGIDKVAGSGETMVIKERYFITSPLCWSHDLGSFSTLKLAEPQWLLSGLRLDVWWGRLSYSYYCTRPLNTIICFAFYLITRFWEVLHSDEGCSWSGETPAYQGFWSDILSPPRSSFSHCGTGSRRLRRYFTLSFRSRVSRHYNGSGWVPFFWVLGLWGSLEQVN